MSLQTALSALSALNGLQDIVLFNELKEDTFRCDKNDKYFRL